MDESFRTSATPEQPNSPDDRKNADAFVEESVSQEVGGAPFLGAGANMPSVVVHSLPEEEETLWEMDPEVEALLNGLPAAPSDADLARLRELLFSREITFLERLKTYIFGPRFNARMVSRVLAEAVALRSREDQKLRTSLEPVVDDIIQRSLRKHQRDFVNVLFPLMGPSIRKSISETFRSMLGNFSKSLEMAFSWKGLRWRLEALRSGKPFSEIVMLHTLVYRVEQIFFIHSETGLVLSHLVNEGVGSQDADMVSAMLTAIQDFARDCFSENSSGDLESLRLGEATIFIEKSPQAYLACVIRGIPPAGFHEQLAMTLEILLMEYADALAGFDGDTADFAGAERHLDNCMVEHYAEDAAKVPLWAKLAPLFLVAGLVGGTGLYQYNKAERLALEEQARQELAASRGEALTLLRTQPGLLLINISDREPPWDVVVMKDELAETPEEVLYRNGLNLALFDIRTIPFVSYDPGIIPKRVLSGIELPDSVTMEFSEDGTLKFRGVASMSWIVQVRDYARTLAGVKKVDVSELHDPMLEHISALKKKVESSSVLFPLGKDSPVGEEYTKLEQIVDTLVEMEKLVQDMGFSLTLTIYGHADTTGSDTRNYELSRDRTRTVAALLYAKGSSVPVSMYGMGSQYPVERIDEPAETDENFAEQGSRKSRRIEFRVHVVRTATPDVDLFR